MTLQRLADEAFGSDQIPVFAEEELDRIAHAVDGAVEIHPAPAHPDISIVAKTEGSPQASFAARGTASGVKCT
jgi:hypothetical protein